MNEHLPEIGFHDKTLRVLLVEDSRFDAELLRETLLASYPHAQLDVVRDEAGFVAALTVHRYDLILSDFELPGFSGEQALAEARVKNPGLPFIFVSGVIGEDNAVEMLKRGATDYVSKSRLVRLPLVIDRALREVAQREAREAAQMQLREANAVFARVVDSLRNYAVILIDRNGLVTSWNQAARDIFGYEAGEMIGRSLEVLFTSEDREAGTPRREMELALARGKADDNRWMQRRDGLRLWAEGVMTPLPGDAQHGGFSKIVRDATADYRDAEALRVAKEEAERANQAKDRFLAVLSHELRTPLSPIATAAHLLEKAADVPQKYRNLLPMIQRNVALEARLIEDLLDLTAISAGKVNLKPRQVDMHELVRVVLDMLDGQVKEKQLHVVLRLEAPVAQLQADEARLQQVLWNLLRNAIKFTPEDGRIEVRTRQEAATFVLDVVDSGIGIEPEALPRIFSAFEQADREVSQRFGGLGLGLAIARGLVAEHKGQLTVASAGRGRGATFTLKLRLGAEGDELGRPGGDSQPVPLADGGWRLLLVEDNQDAADTIVMCLETYGYQVRHVGTCAEAVRTAQAGGFDIVLTDLGLPDGSGIDVGRALSRMLPVVALSGYGATPDLQRSAMAGFAGHLVKPAEPQAIHAALQKALAARAGRAERA